MFQILCFYTGGGGVDESVELEVVDELVLGFSEEIGPCVADVVVYSVEVLVVVEVNVDRTDEVSIEDWEVETGVVELVVVVALGSAPTLT